jgi:hypothetical protein
MLLSYTVQITEISLSWLILQCMSLGKKKKTMHVTGRQENMLLSNATISWENLSTEEHFKALGQDTE